MKKLLLVLCLFMLPVVGRAQAPTWTANVDTVERIDFQLRIVVTYTNGKDKLAQDYRFDGSDIMSQLNFQVAAQLLKLGAVDSATKTIPLGPILPPVKSATTAAQQNADSLITVQNLLQNAVALSQTISQASGIQDPNIQALLKALNDFQAAVPAPTIPVVAK